MSARFTWQHGITCTLILINFSKTASPSPSDVTRLVAPGGVDALSEAREHRRTVAQFSELMLHRLRLGLRGGDQDVDVWRVPLSVGGSSTGDHWALQVLVETPSGLLRYVRVETDRRQCCFLGLSFSDFIARCPMIRSSNRRMIQRSTVSLIDWTVLDIAEV